MIKKVVKTAYNKNYQYVIGNFTIFWVCFAIAVFILLMGYIKLNQAEHYFNDLVACENKTGNITNPNYLDMSGTHKKIVDCDIVHMIEYCSKNGVVR